MRAHPRLGLWLMLVPVLLQGIAASRLSGSTYVVNIPLDSPIYDELETLNGLGYLDTYFDEIKPLSRVEAARLTLEGRANFVQSDRPDPLARELLNNLRDQLPEEIGWLKDNREDSLPTMLHPVTRAEAQYVYSSGSHRHWLTGPGGSINAQEQTPLLPYNDGLPTAAGSNEIVRLSGWGGFGGFLTGYAEGAFSGPLTRDISDASRGQLLGAEAVLSLGNRAVSFGQRERSWGAGYFGPLSQGNNAKPFYALTVASIHPTYLPWIFRYLGPGRREVFLGQSDTDRINAQHAWILGHVMVFKPLPTLELGLTRAIIFGGRNNDHYGPAGFLGRATGLSTGNPNHANTNSRGGAFLKFYFPRLRHLQVYQEMLGEDNLTFEIPTIGRFMPFLNVSYQGGIYLPRLTADGLTDLRAEYAVFSGGYSIESPSSLYWTYHDAFMGNALGPNASRVDLQIGRWFGSGYKASLDFFYTEQAPRMYQGNHISFFPPHSAAYPNAPLSNEHSVGVAFDLLRLPRQTRSQSHVPTPIEALLDGRVRVAVEHVDNLNYGGGGSLRALAMLSVGITPTWPSFSWRGH